MRRKRGQDAEGRRHKMVDQHIVERGIVDEQVIDAMRTVPRECFVADSLAPYAYDDRPLPIDVGQTISQPYIVASMAEAAELDAGSKVLEVGTGSGYGAAVLAHIAAEVWTIERHRLLAGRAEECLTELGIENVHVVCGDGSLGWPAEAPFDAIIVTANAPSVPTPLVDQLADGGRLIIPVGPDTDAQALVRVRRTGEEITEEHLAAVRFVPLIGERGWHPDPD